MNEIILNFKKNETRLAGFPYGEKVYIEQVKDHIDFLEVTKIVFPENIEMVASSFVQGFFSKIIENIGYEGVDKRIKIEAKTDQLAKNILDNLY